MSTSKQPAYEVPEDNNMDSDEEEQTPALTKEEVLRRTTDPRRSSGPTSYYSSPNVEHISDIFQYDWLPQQHESNSQQDDSRDTQLLGSNPLCENMSQYHWDNRTQK
ncbi:hypothetical protein DL765_004537 [Monosporascus sp. GIB2]|nr:hypothetical protein DL765_004537 [Monosporascus sp. GIB2]